MRPSFFYVAYLICCAGVNGSSTHAVKALAGALAERDGYGRGEFSYVRHKLLLVHDLRGVALQLRLWLSFL